MKVSKIVALVALVAAGAALAPSAEAAGNGKQALTLWWVIFNNPDECEDGCSADDLGNPAVAASVVYASGQISRGNGKVRLVASLFEQADGFADELIAGPGLIDAEGAEIHLVVRSHGPKLGGGYLEQITRFADAGCQELGGPNECRDIQFSVHPPGEDASGVFWWPDLEGGRRIRGAFSRLIRDADGVRLVLETDVK